LEYFKNCNIKLEEDIILNHKQYNKTKEFNDENRQLIDELNNYILDNQKNYLNEIRNLIDSFIKIIKNITNKYEKKCTDIINELINIQIWIQNIQKGLKQYSSNLPPESLFNIIENIISIKKDKELDLDNFYGNINETLKKTFEESNTVIKKCENHYNEINKEVNEKLNIYESIFAEYNNEEKISSLKIPISKSLELLKNDLSEFKDYYISSYKLVDVESKALYLYSKFTYVLYSVKAIKDSLKNSEINVKSLNNLKAKVKEIEEEYLTTTLNLEYNECEDVIKSYNENFYEKTNKKELVNLLISKISKLLNTIQTDTYYKYNKLTNKIKNCSNFIDEYEINEKKLLNINEEVNKINDFSTENNICNFEISDYKKVFNEILININSMDINECETYIKSKNNYKNQNIKGIKILINNYNNILEKTIESIKDCNIEQKLINEIYNNNKALNDVFKIISEIKDLIEEFEKTDETNNKIEKKILFECQFNKLEINFKNYNMIFDIYDKYQESFKYCHKYEKIINKIKVDEDNCENEIKQLKIKWKEILNLINKLEEEVKLRKMLEELHKNTKLDEKKYIRELNYLNEICPDKISTFELNNNILKLNKIFDWIDSILIDENFNNYKWDSDPDNLKRIIQSILNKFNDVSVINKSILETQFLKNENYEKMENFILDINNNKKKIAMIINNIIQNGLHQQNIEKLQLNIHSLSQDMEKTNKEILSNNKKLQNIISKNDESIKKYKEEYSDIINTLSSELENLEEIMNEYEDLIKSNNEFLEKINKGFNWYKNLFNIYNNYTLLKENIINCNEIEDILIKYNYEKSEKLDLEKIFSSINNIINKWKQSKCNIIIQYNENKIIPFNSINEFIDINDGPIDINIYNINEYFDQLELSISNREVHFDNINKKLEEIIVKNNNIIIKLLSDFKIILNKENILKYSKNVSNSSEEFNILENNYKIYETQYDNVITNMNCIHEISSLASDIFTTQRNKNEGRIDNLPINIYQLLMSLLNNPDHIWDYSELDFYNKLIKKSIDIVYSYKSKYNDLNNIINNIKLINIKNNENNISIKITELKLFKTQIQEYEKSYNKELEKYYELNDQYKNENNENIQYLISCIKKEFFFFIEISNSLIKDINDNIENEFINIELIKKNENEIDEIKNWINIKKKSIKLMQDNLPPSETLIPLENIVNFGINEDFIEYNKTLKEKINLNIDKGKNIFDINNNNCNIIENEINEKINYVNQLENSLNYIKINEILKDLNDLNHNNEELKILCNFTKLFIDFQDIAYLLYGELVYIYNEVNSLFLKYNEADKSNMNNSMNTIEELNKKFKTIEGIIKDIQNNGIYKKYELNQKMLYKNVLFKINKNEIILQYIIKETKTINELQRKININYDKIKERNSLFKEILLKIDSCEENYKEISEILTIINSDNLNNSTNYDINILYKDLKEKIEKIITIIDDVSRNLNIIDSLTINNKIKYLNNKVLILKENINKSTDEINNYNNLIKQLESVMNLEHLYKDIKNTYYINEEQIKENNDSNYEIRKDYQNSIDKSLQRLIELNNETKDKFNIDFINNEQYKNNLTEYYMKLTNEINNFLENFNNHHITNKMGLPEKEIQDQKCKNNIEKSKEVFRKILKNNYDLINERDNVLINCESLFDKNNLEYTNIKNVLENKINLLKNIYIRNTSLYENITKSDIYENCNDTILYNDIKNIENEWFSNIEYIKQIYIDLEKRNAIISDKKYFSELSNYLLNELPTSEILLNKTVKLTKKNFKEKMENLLQLVSEAINQWNNKANTILSDINNIFKNASNYSKLNIPYIDNENFENFVLIDDSFQFEELNNYVCINISKLNNIKDILYNLINIQNKYEILNNELNERLNIENSEFWKNSFNYINSFNELRIITNQLNQDYENIKKEYNDVNNTLLKYKYYLNEYNMNLFEKYYNNNSYKMNNEIIDKARNKIDEIINIDKKLIDINFIDNKLDIQNSLYNLVKLFREKNQVIKFLLIKSNIIKLELDQSFISSDEINEEIRSINNIINNPNFGSIEIINNQCKSSKLLNKLSKELSVIINRNLMNLQKLNKFNLEEHEKYEIKQNYINIYENNNIQSLKINLHNAMDIYNELIENILIIDYIFILNEKYFDFDINFKSQDSESKYKSIITEINKNFSKYVEDVEEQVDLISNFINNYDILLDNEIKKHKIEESKYYNEICEILFFIDNSKIRISEFYDICNDALSIYKYHNDIIDIHLREKFYINELENIKNNNIKNDNNNNNEFSILSKSFKKFMEKVNNIEKNYQNIKAILNRNSIWDTELFNSIFIINNNKVLQLWNNIKNNIEINKNDENNINYIVNETNWILNNLDDLKNDINQIYRQSLNILIDNSIDMSNNFQNIYEAFTNKYTLCDQICIKKFDNLINYYFNQNFKNKEINENLCDIHNILIQINQKFYNQHSIFKCIEYKKLYLEKQYYIYSLLEKIDKLIDSNSKTESEIEFNIYIIKKYENEIQQFLVQNLESKIWYNKIKSLKSMSDEEKEQCLQYLSSYSNKIYKRNQIICSRINYFMEKNDLTKFKYSISRNSSIQNIYEDIDSSNIK